MVEKEFYGRGRSLLDSAWLFSAGRSCVRTAGHCWGCQVKHFSVPEDLEQVGFVVV